MVDSCYINFDFIDEKYIGYLKNINYENKDDLIQSMIEELNLALLKLGFSDGVMENENKNVGICLVKDDDLENNECFKIELNKEKINIYAKSSKGFLYGIYKLLFGMQLDNIEEKTYIPLKDLRMINHWDNLSGKIERGYAGDSIFFCDNDLNKDTKRIKDYARLLSSIGINAICINNVNVDYEGTRLMFDKISIVKSLNEIFRKYGIRVFISINFAAPIEMGELSTCDPCDLDVKNWWNKKCEEIYDEMPDLGGFVIKADSEGRMGPFAYGRNHADGANMLAEAIKPYGGMIIWRCFVYNCQQDWRDRTTDRAKAAFDNFMPLDGFFDENVYLQVKNGPIDFQVREPVNTLFGAMKNTKLILELQITQEYTGQQKHICYLAPCFKEVLDFDTYGDGGKVYKTVSGLAAVSNIGNDENWTGHSLAQANLYAFGVLSWNPLEDCEKITEDWIKLTFGKDLEVKEVLMDILLDSWKVYESYTAPLGIGFMVNIDHHYGPNVDGYEYSRWGTYHYADHNGIGVDRTIETGTGYAEQYFKPNRSMYDDIKTCPDELLLFFHHVPYNHILKSGKTVIQHIYDSHFNGYENSKLFKEKWLTIKDKMPEEIFDNVSKRLDLQIESAREWCDQINSYFFRKSGIPDEKGRRIY